MDTYEQGKKITVKAEAMKAEAKEHFGQCKELTAAISDFFGSPVIGPVVFWFLHRIVALCTVVFCMLLRPWPRRAYSLAGRPVR